MPHSKRRASITHRIGVSDHEKHDQIVRNIAHNGLSRGLPFFSDKTMIEQSWMEPYLTKNGIMIRPMAGDKVIATPDLLMVTSRPDCLMGIEVKLRNSSGAIRRMDEELRTLGAYLEENGDAVYHFLREQGFCDGIIEDLAIRLCGVVGTRHGKGIMVQRFTDLYDDKLSWN